MAFKGHQGFLAVRRETVIDGVFCRDHALAAYATAQGMSLKGMWFSAGSLIFGAARALWDSAKLLDLPAEVKDEPWVAHKVGCPHCGHEHFSTAGPVACDECRAPFAILSCANCSVIHVTPSREPFDSIEILSCRACGGRTAAPDSSRNAPPLILAKALAEVTAKVARAEGLVDLRERQAFEQGIASLFSFRAATLEAVRSHFDQCVSDRSVRFFRTCVDNCQPEILRLILAFAVSVAEADGPTSETELALLRKFARAMGISEESIFEELKGRCRADAAVPWWIVLGLEATATFEQVRITYRNLARQFHPDLWRRAPDAEQAVAAARMKEINAAYAAARSDLEKRESFQPKPTTESPPQPEKPAEKKPHRRPESESMRTNKAAEAPQQGATSDRPASEEPTRKSDQSSDANTAEPRTKQDASEQVVAREPEVIGWGASFWALVAVAAVFIAVIALDIGSQNRRTAGITSTRIDPLPPTAFTSPTGFAPRVTPSASTYIYPVPKPFKSVEVPPPSLPAPPRRLPSAAAKPTLPDALETAKTVIEAGCLLLRDNRFHEAAPMFNRAIALDAKNEKALWGRAAGPTHQKFAVSKTLSK